MSCDFVLCPKYYEEKTCSKSVHKKKKKKGKKEKKISTNTKEFPQLCGKTNKLLIIIGNLPESTSYLALSLPSSTTLPGS